MHGGFIALSDQQLIAMLQNARLVPQSPTSVCVKCYDEANAYHNVRWLPWLECARWKEHEQEEQVTVIVGDNLKVVRVEELPSHWSALQPSQLTLCRRSLSCQDDNCSFPHSNEELQYWKWSIIHKHLEKVHQL